MSTFEFGNCLIPHPDKADRGGEDALFTSDEMNALGVSDGVGGWYFRGVNPGIYARELMRLTEVAIQAGQRVFSGRGPGDLCPGIDETHGRSCFCWGTGSGESPL